MPCLLFASLTLMPLGKADRADDGGLGATACGAAPCSGGGCRHRASRASHKMRYCVSPGHDPLTICMVMCITPRFPGHLRRATSRYNSFCCSASNCGSSSKMSSLFAPRRRFSSVLHSLFEWPRKTIYNVPYPNHAGGARARFSSHRSPSFSEARDQQLPWCAVCCKRDESQRCQGGFPDSLGRVLQVRVSSRLSRAGDKHLHG